MYGKWNGSISITNTHLSPPRPGDWAENYQPGDLGQNLAGPIQAMIQKWGTNQELSGAQYTYGKAVDITMYLSGPPLAQFTANGNTDSTTLQGYFNGGWQDLTLNYNPQNGNYTTAPANRTVDRVRFTATVKMRFYANLP